MAFTDDFNRSDEFLEADAAWTRLSGAQGSAVDTNQLRVKYASTEGAFTHTDQGSSAHYTQADYISTNNAAAFAICTRLTDANNFIGVRYNGSAAQMHKRVSGSFTLLGSYAYSKAGTETWKLESDSSDNHVLYIGGTSRIAPSSDSFNSTETAQGFVARSGNDVLLDNWSADTVTAGGTTVTPPQGNLTLSASAPTVSVSENVVIQPPQANLVLSSQAPTVQVSTGADVDITVPQGSLTLSATAPSVGFNWNIQVPAADLVLSTFAPTVSVAALINIEVPAANLVLSTFAPTVDQTTVSAVTVPQGNLTLTAFAPTVVTTGGQPWIPVAPSSDAWTDVADTSTTWTDI